MCCCCCCCCRRHAACETDTHRAGGFLLSYPGADKFRRDLAALTAAAMHKDPEQRIQDLADCLGLRAAGEGIYGVNAEGKTTFVNPAAERMLGWSAEELVGKAIHPIVHHTHHDGRHYPDQDCPIYAAFRDGAVHQVDGEVFWRKDGTPVWVEYTSTPIRDGVVVVAREAKLPDGWELPVEAVENRKSAAGSRR